MADTWKTLPDACQAMGISERTLRRWIKAGKIRSKSKGNKLYVRLTDDINLPEEERHFVGQDVGQLLEFFDKILSEKDARVTTLQSEIQYLRLELSRIREETNAAFQSEIEYLRAEMAKLREEANDARQRADDIILQFINQINRIGQAQIQSQSLMAPQAQIQTQIQPPPAQTILPTVVSESATAQASAVQSSVLEPATQTEAGQASALRPPPSALQEPSTLDKPARKVDTDEEKMARLQQYVPEYLRDKILATKGHVEGERKAVTILFSDISGFTALSEKFIDDPEEVGLIIDHCHKTLGKVIYKYEGVVDKIIGDAIMALFGAPIAHENDPERAILAALEMMDTMKKLSQDLTNRLGIPPLTIHIGINTGMVMVGSIGTDLRLDYTVMGDAVNLASRLEGVSKANQIVVSHNTYRLAKTFFDFKDLEPVVVQGKKDPIQIYEVVGRKAKRQSERGLEGLESKLIGREAELKTLQRCADELLANRQGQLISLIGEAGLGKSRLKVEFKKYFEDKITWLEGGCLSHTQNTSYSLFLNLLRGYLDITEFSEESEVKEKLFEKMRQLFPDPDNENNENNENIQSGPVNEILPYIGNLLSLKFEGELGEKLKYLEAQQLQTRTFMAIRDLFLAESKQRPVVIALDDLHWLDDMSLNLIFFLLDWLPNEPIIMLCIYRPERSDACWQIGQTATGRIAGRYTEVTLSKLTTEASENLLDALIKIENPELKRLIMKKSEGNPFYIEEVIRTLIEDSTVVKDENGKWSIKRKVEDISVPSTVEGVIMARIDRLLDESKYVLQRSSVIGRVFQSPILSYVCHDIGELDERLQNLMSLELINEAKPMPEAEYIFRHILTYEMSYKSIMGPRRRDFHERVGDAIEKIYAKRLNEHLEILAHHYLESNHVDKAVNYSIKAGHKARGMYDNTNAIYFYESALNKFGKLQTPRPDLQMEVYEGLGEVYMLIGKYEDAINNYTLKLQLAEDSAVQARMNRKLGEVYEKTAKYDIAMEHFNKGMEFLGSDNRSVEAARLLGLIGLIHWRKSDYDRALEQCKNALKLVEGTDNYDVIANLYNRLGDVSGSEGKGDIELALNYYKQSLEMKQKIGDLLGESVSYNALGFEYQKAGRIDEALESLTRCLELKTQIGDTQGIGVAWNHIATAYYKMGEYDKAIEDHQKSVEIFERIGSLDHAAAVYNNLGMIHQRKDEFEKAMEYYEMAMRTFDQIGATSKAAICAYNIGDTYCDRGELDKAQSFLDRALERFQKVGHAIGIARAYNSLGKASYKIGEAQKAVEYYLKGLEISENSNDTRGRGLAYYELGRAYAKLNDINLAKNYLSKALEVFEVLKAAPDIKKVKDLLADLTK